MIQNFNSILGLLRSYHWWSGGNKVFTKQVQI